MSRGKRNRNKPSPGPVDLQNRPDLPAVSPEASAVGLLSSYQEMRWAGPLPPPEVLRGYEKVVPGAADRLLTMAEAQSKHRMALEERALASSIVRSYCGLAAGFILSLVLICLGAYAIIEGHDWAGATIITGTIVSLATVFVIGRQATSSELAKKADLVKRKA